MYVFNKNSAASSLSLVDTKYDKSSAEYFASFGYKMEAKNNNTFIMNNGQSVIDGWNTAYGSVKVVPKKNHRYCWVFGIHTHHTSTAGAIAIGIEEITKDDDHITTNFHGYETTKHYAYTSDGKKYSHLCPKGKQLCSKYQETGSIVMMLLDGYKLSYCRIDEKFVEKNKIQSIQQYIDNGAWVLSEKKIAQNVKYRMAVSLYGKTRLSRDQSWESTSIEILKYKLIVNENDDEKDEESQESSSDEEDDEKKDVDNALNKAMLTLEQQMANFEKKFNDKTIKDDATTHQQSVKIMDGINALEKRMRSFHGHLEKVKEYIASVTPDVAKYEEWNLSEMIAWISSLDNGAYVGYTNALQAGFQSDDILTGEFLPDIKANDLRNEPFNIKSFPVRSKLVKHFQALKNQTID